MCYNSKCKSRPFDLAIRAFHHGISIFTEIMVMKKTMLFLLFVAGLMACNKDKFQTVPQIQFLSLNPTAWSRANTNLDAGPKLSIRLTDAEGDFGGSGNLRSYIYLRDTASSINRIDSFAFPDIPVTNQKNMDIQLDFRMIDVLRPASITGFDTFYFQVYVKDFANNKSNVLAVPPIVLTP